MTNAQRTYALLKIHKTPLLKRAEILKTELNDFGINEKLIEEVTAEIGDEFASSIGKLNTNQLNNLIDDTLIKAKVNHNKIDTNYITDKLTFYGVVKQYHPNIIDFLTAFTANIQSIRVEDLETNFKGVQVATNDDFDTILKKGYTGDWVLSPDKITNSKVQIASMLEKGKFTRGWYINADITRVEPIQYNGKTRYRIFFSNPTIINTGKSNVKFTQNPVAFID